MIPYLGKQEVGTIMGTLSSSPDAFEAQSKQVAAVAIPQIKNSGDRAYLTGKKMPLFLERLTEVGLLEFILNEFLSPQELFNALESLNEDILNVESSWSSFYKRLQKKYPTVRNLDELGAGPLLGITATSVEPIQSTKKSIRDLAAAGLMAKLSEDGGATIVTIPADWSIEKLEDLSKKAVEEMNIPSARIHYGDGCKEILQQHPTQEAQTIVLTNTVIGDRSAATSYAASSRGKKIKEQKAHLVNHGFKEFPDALTTLTATVLTRILTQGQSSLYSWTDMDAISVWTRTKQHKPRGHLLCVGSASYCVWVIANFDFGDVGVGASGSSKDIRDWKNGL